MGLVAVGVGPSAGGSSPSAGRSTPGAGGGPLPEVLAPTNAPSLPSSASVALVLSLQPSDGTALQQFDAQLVDPSSPVYHHFLTEAEFESRFAPSVANVTAAESYLRAHGASSLVVTPDRMAIQFDMSAAAIHSTFGVTLRVTGRSTAGPLYAPDRSPQLAARIGAMAVGLDGLSNTANPSLTLALQRTSLLHASRLSRASQFVTVNGTGQQLYIGSDVVQAYGESAGFPSSNSSGGRFATGEAVATLLFSGFNNTTGQDLPPFDPSVIGQYFNDTFPSGWPTPTVTGVPVTLGSVTPPLPGPLGTLGDDTLAQSENSLDLEMAGSAAPGAALYTFYFAYSTTNAPASTEASTADEFASALAQALSYNYSPAHLDAVSNSYGLPDLDDALWDLELVHAAAIGVTIVAASGDQGDAPNADTGRGPSTPIWPSTAAFDSSGVLSVGGIAPTLSGLPTGGYDPDQGVLNITYDANVTGVASQQAWYDTSGGVGNYAGSEGGISTVYAEPSWQRHSAAQPTIVNATVLQGAAALGRAVPDLALAATDFVTFLLNNSTGLYFVLLSGTSAASPLVAGTLAETAAQLGHPLGFIDPFLYQLGSFEEAEPLNTSVAALQGVPSGSNYLFSASSGWDALTGWGALLGGRLAEAVNASAVTGFNYSGPSPGLPPGGGTTFIPAPTAPVLVWIVLGALAIGIVVAIVLLARYETRPAPPPPPAAYGRSPYGGVPPPVSGDVVCQYCGRPRAPWLGRCPYCGAP
jgi:subtilase family serine protease